MFRTILLALALTGPLIAQSSSQERAAWNRPVKPFRIAGSVYYVGVFGVSAFLITTPQGAILLDGGFPETAPLIEKNISELGFQIRDVKFLLNSHAHYDHCGGLTELKRRSGARMVASEGDSRSVSGVRKLDCSDPHRPLEPVTVDRVIGDNEAIQLGGSVLTAHLTPGHTKGCTTWSTLATEGGKTHRVVFYCSTSVAGNRLAGNAAYPNIVSDYEMSFAKLRNLACDVFLAPHGSFFHLDKKRAAIHGGSKDAFVDSTEMRKYVLQSEKAFRAELIRQQRSRTMN